MNASTQTPAKLDFLNIADHSPQWLGQVLAEALRLRGEREQCVPHRAALAGRTIAMIFEKPSLRTRASFEIAVTELGGHLMSIRPDEVGLGKRESPADVARVLSGMVHGIIARVFEHAKLDEMAMHATVPVINALSDDSHPCQALADVMTMMDEFGQDLAGRKIAFVGDGNNVAVSLAMLSGKLGIRFVLAAPQGYAFSDEQLATIRSGAPGIELSVINDARDAVRDADVVYTDTWVSMGQEEESAERRAAFSPYQVNGDLVAAAPDHAIVMHCLPAYRGVEITDEVMDGPRSRVFVQAHNRLHAQKGLLSVMYQR